MRCMWCGKKYNEECDDVTAGYCSKACEQQWEKQVEKKAMKHTLHLEH